MKKYWLLLVLCGCVEHYEKSEIDLNRENTLNRIAKLKVDYICPGSGVKPEFKEEYLNEIKKFGIEIPAESFINKKICSFADTDSNRFDRFMRSVTSDSNIVWALLGGFGSYKLPILLDSVEKPKKKKFLVGFSDITALNLYVSQNWNNWTVIHAPVFSHVSKSRYQKDNWNLLLNILEHKTIKYQLSNLLPLNKLAERNKKIDGKLTGGNLTLVESSLGTNWEIQTKGKIVFLEDCNESAPSVYRSLYHLKMTGKFNKAKAVIFGYFLNSNDYKKYLRSFAQELNIPVFITDKFGHGKKNLPLVYNADSSILNNCLTVDLK